MKNKKEITPRRPIPTSGYDRLQQNITPIVKGINPPETRANINRGNITSRKDLIWHLLIEKGYDHQFVFDYLLM